MLLQLIKDVFYTIGVKFHLNKKRPRAIISISPTKLRNWFIGDPILDWFNLHGEEKGFQKDEATYINHILQRGISFEQYVLDALEPKIRNFILTDVGKKYSSYCPEGVSYTRQLMHKSCPIIYQGQLCDEQLGVHGMPDLLIHKHIFHQIFDNVEPLDDSQIPYIVVDIKCSSLQLGAKGQLLNNGSMKAYKAQLFVYCKILENMWMGNQTMDTQLQQPIAFLLGRCVKQRTDILDGKTNPVKVDLNDEKMYEKVPLAMAWYRDCKENGSSWDVYNPQRNEMRVNMKNGNDSPWHSAKKLVAERQNDLTQLWGISKQTRDDIADGTTTIGDYCSDVKNEKRRKTVETVHEMNSDSEDDMHMDIEDRQSLRDALSGKMNFYVDFEFINSVEWSYEPVTRNHLYMIGCGYEKDGEFIYKCFIPRQLTAKEEKLNIYNWLQYMYSISRQQDKQCQVIHWTRAEPNMFDKLKVEFGFRGNVQWFDLHPVFRDNQIVCKGMKNFSLKSVAKSMKELGYIQTIWEDSIHDGIGANMIVLEGIQKNEQNLQLFEKMHEVEKYNLVDCKTMWELVKYLQPRI